MAHKRKSVYETVREVLRTKPKARDSDAVLIIEFFIRWGGYLTPELKRAIHKVGSFESITRARRQIQHDGEYPATVSVQERRAKAREEIHARKKRCRR